MFRQVTGNCEVLNQNVVERMILSNDFNSPCTIMYSRKLLNENMIRFREDVKMGEDFLFNAEYLKVYKHANYIRKSLYNYRYNNHSATNTFSVKYAEDTGIGYFYRRSLLVQYYNNTDLKNLYNDLYISYLKNARSYLLNGIISNAKKEELIEIINLNWVQDLLKQKVNGIIPNLTKFIIKKKWLFLLGILANIKRMIR